MSFAGGQFVNVNAVQYTEPGTIQVMSFHDFGQKLMRQMDAVHGLTQASADARMLLRVDRSYGPTKCTFSPYFRSTDMMQQRHDEGHTVNDPTRTFRHATRSSAAGDTRGATFEPLEPRVLLSADLTGSFQPLPGTAGVGAPVVIALDLENIGDTKGKGSVPIDVYLSSDDVLDISDTLLATTKGKASIAPGESKPGKPIKKLTVPSSVAPGGYRLIAVIDPDELTEDDDRSNNTVVSQSITITPPDYDLSVALDTGKMPASLLAGAPKAKAKVRVLISKSGDTPLDKKQTVDIRVIARPAGIVGNAQDLVLVDLAGAKLGNPKEGKPKKFNLKPDLSGIPAGEYEIEVEIMGVGL